MPPHPASLLEQSHPTQWVIREPKIKAKTLASLSRVETRTEKRFSLAYNKGGRSYPLAFLYFCITLCFPHSQYTHTSNDNICEEGKEKGKGREPWI
jgi:hypothetical protein